jgi:phosphomannomutase
MEGKRVVAVSGYFNPVHKGHIDLFKEARALGDKLVVVLNNDRQVSMKGSQKFMSEYERKAIIEAIRYVDEVIVSVDDDGTQCKTLELLKPHIFANGGDRRGEADIPEAEVCARYNIQMQFNVGGEKVQSSSWLLGSVKETKIFHDGLPNQDLLKQKKVIITDVDGTICETCQEITPQMAEQINKLIEQGHTMVFISGTPLFDLQRMISSGIKGEHHLLANTGTIYGHVTDETKIIYNKSLSSEEKQEITAACEKLIEQFDLRTLTTKEDQLQDRNSQITLSAIGRHAPIELKEQYDPDGTKRKEQVRFLKQHLSVEKYEIKYAGTTSIDVTQKGLDKEQGIRNFCEFHNIPTKNVLFFGDKMDEQGNDYPASKVVDCIAVKNPDDTLKKLKTLFP